MTGDNLPDIPEEVTEAVEEVVYFVPSHLTKGLVSGGLALVLGTYAFYQFSKVDHEEIQAFLHL